MTPAKAQAKLETGGIGDTSTQADAKAITEASQSCQKQPKLESTDPPWTPRQQQQELQQEAAQGD